MLDHDPERVLALLRAHLDAEGFEDLEARVHGMMWPDKSAADDPLVELTRRTAEGVYGIPSAVVPMTGGSSPTYAFSRPLVIPVVTAGLGYPGSRTHSPDEQIRLSDLLLASRHIARILDGFADL